MPRFDEGEQNLKLIKGNIVLMGNPDQYGEILAENIFVEDITRTALQTLISNSELVRGKYYRITNAVGSTLSLVVKAVTANVLDEVAVNSTNGDNVIYNISTDVATVPYADVYVPYTGATTDVDLGENGLATGFVTYDTTPTGTPTSQATTYWDSTEETLAIIMNGVTQRVGLDSYFNVKNQTGSSIPKGTAVRFAGTDGNSGNLLIAPMLADGTYPSVYYMGVTAETIDNGQFGKVMSLGKLRTNTNAYNDGDILYVSSTVAGGFQTTAPSAPNNIIIAAAVVNAANNGILEVRATLGSNINNDEGVKITTPLTGQLLQLQSNGLWENKTKAQVLGGTSSQFVKGDGSLDSNTYLTGNQTITLSGEASGSGATTINVTLDNAAVIAKVLTGLSVSGSAVVSTDSILTAIGKLQNQVNALAGGVSYQGTWNASTNTPSLSSGVGTKGYYYVVSVAGSTNLDGITDWKLGDWAIFNGTTWDKVDNTDAVISVNGYTGIVTLAKGDIGLGNVENTALSTWAGSTNITTIKSLTSSATEIITFGATDTGEAHIFGGSARVNGTMLVTGAVTGSSTAQFTKLGLGGAAVANTYSIVSGNATGATSLFGTRNNQVIQSDVTGNYYTYYGNIVTQAASFTLGAAFVYAADSATIGAGSAITNLIGFFVGNSFVGGTNTYGFRSAIASGTGRWNTYMDGTASNYFAGNLNIGLSTQSAKFVSYNTGLASGVVSSNASARFGNISGSSIIEIGVNSSGDAYIQAARTSDNTAQVLSLQPFGGATTIGGSLTGSSTAQFTKLGLGTTPSNFRLIEITSALTGGTNTAGVNVGSTINSDSTSSASIFRSNVTTQASAFTLTNLIHFLAIPTTFGAGSTVTNQYGFSAESTLTGATNNYGFYGNIASGTNRWNFYANGTAANYFNGDVLLGTTTPISSAKLVVTSTTQGFLPPRMTTAQRDAIASPVAGLVIYNTSTNKLNVYTTAWEAVTSA
jgi:hypothetical protein